MSLARIYITKKVRKDWKCGKCGAAIKKGVDGRLSFAVGFRGFERTRCLKPECRPTRSELESSLVATVYDAQDSVDFATLESAEDFTNARDEIVSACEEVSSEYESNEMYDINYDLQERADQVRGAGDELASWEPENDEPEEDVYDTDQYETFDEAHQAWVDETRESFESAVNDMDLP